MKQLAMKTLGEMSELIPLCYQLIRQDQPRAAMMLVRQLEANLCTLDEALFQVISPPQNEAA